MPSREDDGSDSDGSFWRFRPDRDDAASAAVTPDSAREDDDARARRPPAAAAAAAARRRAKSAPEAAAAERLVAHDTAALGGMRSRRDLGASRPLGRPRHVLDDEASHGSAHEPREPSRPLASSSATRRRGRPRSPFYPRNTPGARAHLDAGIPAYRLPNGKRAFYYHAGGDVVGECAVAPPAPPARPTTLRLARRGSTGMPASSGALRVAEARLFPEAFRPAPALCAPPRAHTLAVADARDVSRLSAFGDVRPRAPVFFA